MVSILFSAMAVAFSGAVMPGPLLTYTIRQSLVSGPKTGFLVILGHAALEVLLIAFILFGFDTILQSGAAQTGIGLVGGLWLAWMGVGMIRDAVRNRLVISVEGGEGTGRMVASGFLISAMNPYFLLWWAIIGLGFLLAAYQAFGLWGVAVYYLGHVSVDFLWYGFVSTLVGKTRRFLGETPYRILVGALGGMLIYFGITFLISAVQSLIG